MVGWHKRSGWVWMRATLFERSFLFKINFLYCINRNHGLLDEGYFTTLHATRHQLLQHTLALDLTFIHTPQDRRE